MDRRPRPPAQVSLPSFVDAGDPIWPAVRSMGRVDIDAHEIARARMRAVDRTIDRRPRRIVGSSRTASKSGPG
jgi:hypothetical protein